MLHSMGLQRVGHNNRARTSDRFYVGVSFEIDLKNQEKIDSF